jgi:ribosomal protein L11 methyltransferase
LRLTLRTDKDQAERYADALEAGGALSVSLEDAGDEPLLATADEATPYWSQLFVSALFPADASIPAILAQLMHTLHLAAPPVHVVDGLPDQDWERAWMDRFQPIHCGGALWIVPSWLPAPDPTAVNIVLDPGLAFGTGTHATTALCLAWLAAHPPVGLSVIDVGCGSGILAVAALKLGATQAYGTDVDPRALEVSRENAARNGVTERLQLCLPAALPALQVDLVLANILAQPLIQLATDLTALVKPGGHLILSGMLENQVEEVSHHYRAAFDLTAQTRDHWALLAGRRRRA